MRILITGVQGQLGSQLMDVLRKGRTDLGKIHGIYMSADIKGVDKAALDITDFAAVVDMVEAYRPDLIINCSAYTDVDGCEKNKDLAFQVNALGVRNLAMAGERISAKLVHLSTDYVFSGEGYTPYAEYDLPAPVSVYGKTKLLGEEYVKSFSSRYFILRTAWLYGYYGKNFVKTVIKAATEKDILEVVNDQIGNPTNAEDLIHHLLSLALTDEYGTYHCTGAGECSWFDFAERIVCFTGIPCTVTPIDSTRLNRAARRPAYSSLDNMMLRNSSVGDRMRHWEDALRAFIERYKGCEA